MRLPRSTLYDAPAVKSDEAGILARVRAICDEFEAYGYRRVGAELRYQGSRFAAAAGSAKLLARSSAAFGTSWPVARA